MFKVAASKLLPENRMQGIASLIGWVPGGRKYAADKIQALRDDWISFRLLHKQLVKCLDTEGSRKSSG